MSPVLVSALINNYNYARFLPAAIDSVLAQTHPNIEILVVDDGSTDHSLDVLRGYGEKIRIVSTENGGQAHAINVGLPHCRGEIVAMLDADDTWLPDKIERTVALAAARPKAAMFYHRYRDVLNDGRTVGPPIPPRLIQGRFRRRYLAAHGSIWNPVMSVLSFRRSFLERVLPIQTYPARAGADTMLVCLALLLDEVAAEPGALTRRLLHGANMYGHFGRMTLRRNVAAREDDITRVEWKTLTLEAELRRLGEPIALSYDYNTWRNINLYVLGRIGFWPMLRSCLTPSDMGRWHNLRRAVRALGDRRRERQAEAATSD